MALFAGAAPATAQSPEPEPSGGTRLTPPEPGRRRVPVPLVPLRLAYPLPDAFLIAGSDTAWLAGRRLRPGVDYLLDPTAGTLRVVAPFATGDTLHLVYRTWPLGLAVTYGAEPRWRRGDEPEEREPIAESPREPGQRPLRPGLDETAGVPELRFTGNKTVAVEFGSRQDATLRQTLDLTARGRLADDVDLVALLSDRDTPLTESGETRTLRELDKILVEVRAPQGQATLGDYTLIQGRGEFGRFERELTGVRALAGDSTRVEGSLALVKGEFRSISFRGEEGRQGPYFLPGDGGAGGAPVVAGSERVWVDGLPMTRGETADYAIDYERGRITFAARRPISAESRIAVDYQLANTPYRRAVARASSRFGRGPLRFYAQAVREGDDAGRPSGPTLTESDRLAIAAAGDSVEEARASGVSPGPGDYDRVEDGAGASWFAFAGPDSGAFRVEFLELGAGQGSYVESTQVAGRSAFRFVGAGAGTHAPGRRLALPAEHLLVGGGGRFDLTRDLWLEGEVASSRRDPNRLSALDDGDDRGTATRLALGAAPALAWGDRSLGRLEFEAGLRRLDERFRPLGRIEEAFFQEEWGVNVDRPLSGRDRRWLALGWRPTDGLRLGGERARLAAAGGFVARRWRAEGVWQGRFAQRFRYDHVESRQDSLRAPGADPEGGRDKWIYRAEWSAATAFRPSFFLDYEDRLPPGEAESAAERYRAWETAVRGAAGALGWSAGFAFRRDFDRAGGEWVLDRTARTLHGEVSAAPTSRTRITLGGSHRVSERLGASERASDNGFARVLHGDAAGRLRQEASFEWLGESLVRRVREVIFVGEGAGGFDSLGNFVGRGDYDLRVREDPGDLERQTRTRFSSRTRLRPWPRGPAPGRWWQGLLATTTFQSTGARAGGLVLVDLVSPPGRLRNDPEVRQGSFLWRQEIELPGRGGPEVFLRLERRVDVDRQVVNFAESRSAWAEELRVRFRRGRRWILEARARAAQREAEQRLDGESALERTLDERTAALELTWVRDERLRLGGVLEWERIAAPGAGSAITARLGPRVLYAVGNRVRAEARAGWAAVVDGGTVPSLVPSGLPRSVDRLDARADLSYRLRERANLTFSWLGRLPEGGELVQTARGELRAFF